jgi:putative ABC transport system substrate-binding protein
VTSRSTFIRSLAAGFLAAALATLAQQPAKLHRIGVLANEDNPPWEGFRRGLRDLGYVDGGNVTGLTIVGADCQCPVRLRQSGDEVLQ